jgi:hypothetical protein
MLSQHLEGPLSRSVHFRLGRISVAPCIFAFFLCAPQDLAQQQHRHQSEGGGFTFSDDHSDRNKYEAGLSP